MRYWLIAAAALAAATGPVIAAEATPGWQFYQDDKATNGLLMAFVQSTDGSQFMLKCDKPGKGSVYAVMVATKPVAKPAVKFTMRPVSLRYDAGQIIDDRWRYFGNTVTATDKPGERQLSRLLEKMENAKQLEIRLDPEGVSATGNTTTSNGYTSFDVHDSGLAIQKVYESCKDTRPARS